MRLTFFVIMGAAYVVLTPAFLYMVFACKRKWIEFRDSAWTKQMDRERADRMVKWGTAFAWFIVLTAIYNLVYLVLRYNRVV